MLVFGLWCVVSGAGAQGVVVLDQEGRTVALESPATRIATLAPHATEIVFAVGAGDRLIGIPQYSDYPPEAAGRTVVASGFGVDYERLYALDPDLVIVWRSGNGAGTVERLVDLGFTVYVSEPAVLSDVSAMLRDLGVLTGRSAQAEVAAQRFEQQVAVLEAAHEGAANVSVFYQISDRPLMTLNDEHMLADVLRVCGGRNVFGDMSSIAPVVGVEDVLLRDPEVILLSSGLPDVEALRDHWEGVGHLSAARRGAVYEVSADYLNRSGPRLVNAVEEVCAYLDDARGRVAQ